MEASSTQKDEFLKEIELMKRVSLGKCIYIVNTIGCCTLQEPIALVMEYVPYGNLLGYLRTSRKLRPVSREVCVVHVWVRTWVKSCAHGKAST